MLFRLIREHAADMIAVVDVNGRRLYNSPSGVGAWLFPRGTGYGTNEPAGKKGSIVNALGMRLEQARQTGQGSTLEYPASVIRTAPGNLSASPLRLRTKFAVDSRSFQVPSL